MLEILLGRIPEAIYFALFMIFTKQLKEKRVLYVILMIIEYLLLEHVFHYQTWFQISYTFISFLILKLIYKEKAQVTDIFIFTISSIILILVSMITYFITWFTLDNLFIGNLIQKIILFIVLIICKPYLPCIQLLYKHLWNRNNLPKKMKSTTFRALNVVIFNVLFYVINVGMITSIILNGGD